MLFLLPAYAGLSRYTRVAQELGSYCSPQAHMLRWGVGMSHPMINNDLRGLTR